MRHGPEARSGVARRKAPIAVACCAACAIALVALQAREPLATELEHQRAAPDSALLQRMLYAEDSRAMDSASLAPLYQGMRSTDADTRRLAARAFGRLERYAGMGLLREAIDDPSADVRAEAINGIGQILNGEAGRARAAGDSSGATERAVTSAVTLLRRLSETERDNGVRSAIVRTLGRLPYANAAAARAAVADSSTIRPASDSASGARRESSGGGVAFDRSLALAVDGLLRRFPPLRRDEGIRAAASALRVGDPVPTTSASADRPSRELRVLRASIRGRLLGGQPGEGGFTGRNAVARAFVADFRDSDPQVRRQVISMVAAATALDDTARSRLVDAALRDPSPHVRVEGVRAYARRANASCAPLLTATRDSNSHVALAAIDALAVPCAGGAEAAGRLVDLVRAIPPGAVPRTGARGTWHPGAHAVVSLARVAPDRARPMLAALLAHPRWQVRMYAATAAGAMADTASLSRLAKDFSDNVRDAVVNALSALVRPGGTAGSPPTLERHAWIDSVFIAQLERTDYQLVLDAARALEGAPTTAPLGEPLFRALQRLSASGSETSRDPRMEILARIQSVGAANQAARLTPYLADFDPAVAQRAATVLRAWGVPNASPAPRTMEPLPVSLGDARRLRNARVRVTMAPQSGGGSFELALFVDEAPVTVSRFVSLARQGYYNGLTFHRVATNFVIQGGSPGANEYVGADRFMRDELGLRSHARGTLGISTRGRDTGDAQIFVNLIDNFRLDHDYTVFAEVVRGMDVVDAVVEGDVIARVEVAGAR